MWFAFNELCDCSKHRQFEPPLFCQVPFISLGICCKSRVGERKRKVISVRRQGCLPLDSHRAYRSTSIAADASAPNHARTTLSSCASLRSRCGMLPLPARCFKVPKVAPSCNALALLHCRALSHVLLLLELIDAVHGLRAHAISGEARLECVHIAEVVISIKLSAWCHPFCSRIWCIRVAF